jgi:hypothetical protein
MTPMTACIGSWIVLAILVLFLVLTVVFLFFVGWGLNNLTTGQSMSTSGNAVMTYGSVATLALGIGLLALVFHSTRKVHD